MSFPLWQKAAAFAARTHRHQLRKDGETPYISHVFRVAMTARHVFGCGDETTLCIALLHDTIEDTGVDYDEIAEAFGEEVARGVAALTKNAAMPEPEREVEYDARLARADWRARLVKLADTYDNLADVMATPPERRTKTLERAVAKCRRAVDLAREDAMVREESRRGIAAVEGLLAQTL